MKKTLIALSWMVGIVIGLAFVTFIGWRMFFVTNVEKHEFAFSFNRWSGEITPVSRSGWITYLPWVETIHTIDTRPYQISINADIRGSGGARGNSVARRVLNAKLVRFNPAGLTTFIQWHGRDAGDSLTSMLEILKAYAFDQNDGRECPFLTVESQLGPKALAATPIK